MKLKRLIIQGFKSFKDRTTIHFDDGITGIVGPNGCGKSNIVDALFWVMGEQSAKHLRGSTMKDVIFSGSSKYSPSSFAEATLVLDNSEGRHIHIGQQVASPSEIQLTRKLYRNGESEYRINNHPARLKDIQEVFMDTGAGAKSYSIIAQGEINRLVQAKPEERRVMIEEVAGVTKFKLRKRESLRKIEQTESNLARLQDLKTEIEKNLKALQKQAEKAARARTLKEKIRRHDLIVQSHRVFELLRSFSEAKNLMQERTLEIESWRLEKEQLEVSLQSERITKEEKTAKLESEQKFFNEMSRTLAASEERFTHLCQVLTDREKELERGQKEIVEIAAELEERTQKREDLKAKIQEIEQEEFSSDDFALKEEALENLNSELELRTDALDNLKEELSEKKQALNELSGESFKNSSLLTDYAAQLEDMAQEIESLEKQYSGANGEMTREREELKNLDAAVESLKEKEAELQGEVQCLDEEYKIKSKDFSEKSKELIQKESRLNSLIEINHTLEGSKAGALKFLQENPESGLALFGNLIKCPDEYTKAVAALLSPYLDALIALHDQSARSTLWEWHQKTGEEAFDFLSLGESELSFEESAQRLELKGLSGIISLDQIIEWPEDFNDEIKTKWNHFLSGLFIVDHLSSDEAEKLMSDVKFRAIAGRDGQMVLRKGEGLAQVSSLKEEMSGGVVERNNLIEKLKVETSELKEICERLSEELSTEEEALAQKREELTSLQEDFRQKRGDAHAMRSGLDSRAKHLEVGTDRLRILQNRHTEISKGRLDLLEKEETYQEKEEELKSVIEELSDRLETAQSEWEDIKDQYQAKREEFIEDQVKKRSFAQRLESVQTQIEDIEDQLAKLAKRQENHEQRIELLKQEIEETTTEAEELEEKNKEEAAELSGREKHLSGLKDELAQLLNGMLERENRVKDLNSSISKAEKEIVEANSRQDRAADEEALIVRDIFEKYRIDIRASVSQHLELEESAVEELKDLSDMFTSETDEGTKEIVPESYEFTRRYGQDLKDSDVKLRSYRQEFNRLGEINWQAIEDYERQKLRFDFLQAQEMELTTSLQDLKTAIEHIDEKSRERFKMAFEAVNKRFEKVFPIIFGGGSAELRVVGHLDDPECGVDIIAQPPGKKMQNINLMSGGEKALTAVSLIFSIFLVKPSPFCLLDEVDAPLDDANVGRFNELLREMSHDSQFILITHNKKTMELNDVLYGVTMQEAGVSKAVSVQLH